MILVSGAAGFIGSCLAAFLNKKGHQDLLLVDDFSREDKKANWEHLNYEAIVPRKDLEQWLSSNPNKIEFIFHLGARTDTAEKDETIFKDLNLDYSKMLWNYASKAKCGFIYASSAATYGLGEFGYRDDQADIPDLKPLNPYGQSKQDFDLWALKQFDAPKYWAGFKFFNVYGPNEYHKGRMASVIFHCFNQIKETGKMRLFQSHHVDFADGEQQRDFVYVKDLCEVLYHFYQEQWASGIFNLGSGGARSFNDLAKATFSALNLEPKIEYIPTPLDIRDTYQYFTEASLDKLRSAGYKKEFTSLEEGCKDYVQQYLLSNKYFQG